MPELAIGPIENVHGERIAHSFTSAEAPGSGRDLVVIGHGVTSDRTRPWSVALAEALAARGIASLRIAFSGNGDSGGRFEDSNITKEVDDLGSVLDALQEQGDWRVAYAGHSMGGAVGVLRAARDSRIRSLVSLAAMVHTRAFVERMFGHLVPGKDVMLEKPHCPLTEQYIQDLTSIDTVVGAGEVIRVPWLLVHGSEDDVVPLQDSRDMYAGAGERPELAVLKGIDHSFTGAGIAAMTGIVAPWLASAFERLEAVS